MSIFDQLGKIVPSTSAPAASEQNRPAYLDRLMQSKAETTQRITNMFAELGKAYYESHADDHQTEYEKHLTTIRDAYAEIAQFEQQTDEIAARKRCPACGAQLAEGSRFCNFCGTKLPEIQPDTSTDAKAQRLCPKCHAALGPNNIFCTSCGADLRGGTRGES